MRRRPGCCGAPAARPPRCPRAAPHPPHRRRADVPAAAGGARAPAAPAAAAGRQGGVHFLLGDHPRRHRRDDHGAQLVTGAEIRDAGGLAARMILTPRLSISPCVNIRNPSSVRTMMVGPPACADRAVLHLGDGDGRRLGRRGDGGRPGHAGLQLLHGQRLAVHGEAEVVGHRDLPASLRAAGPPACCPRQR